jgi:hypothetical protein
MIAAPLMDVRTDPLNMGMGGVALMADAPSATIWGVIALPKRVACVGVIVINQIKYVAAQQVAPTCPKRMEFARDMVELKIVKFMDVQGVYYSPECAIFITITLLFALQSMRMQWWGKMTSAKQRRRWHQLWIFQ